MKRTRLWFIGAFVMITALLIGATLRARQNPLYQLSRYPKTPAFDAYKSEVMSELKSESAATESLLNIAEPLDGEAGMMLKYNVKPSGEFILITHDYNVKFGGSGQGAVVKQKELTRIKTLIGQLPPSAAPNSRQDLLVVLVYQPAPAQLRLYDRRHPPPQIREIVGILSAAMEENLRPLPAGGVRVLPHLRSSLRPLKSPSRPKLNRASPKPPRASKNKRDCARANAPNSPTRVKSLRATQRPRSCGDSATDDTDRTPR